MAYQAEQQDKKGLNYITKKLNTVLEV
jgi:hypothetical protein